MLALCDDALYAAERKKDLSALLQQQAQLKRQLTQAEEESLEKSATISE